MRADASLDVGAGVSVGPEPKLWPWESFLTSNSTYNSHNSTADGDQDGGGVHCLEPEDLELGHSGSGAEHTLRLAMHVHDGVGMHGASAAAAEVVRVGPLRLRLYLAQPGWEECAEWGGCAAARLVRESSNLTLLQQGSFVWEARSAMPPLNRQVRRRRRRSWGGGLMMFYVSGVVVV